MTALYKTTIVIWSGEPVDNLGPEDGAGHWTDDPVVLAAKESYDGAAICSVFESELVEEPEKDPTFAEVAHFFEEREEESE